MGRPASIRGSEVVLTAASRLGVTGHTALTATTADLVGEALHGLLDALATPMTGVSCLARGADRIFASIVLELGGHLEVVLPSLDYRRHIADRAELAHYDRLVSQASRVRTLPYGCAGPTAYTAASSALVRCVDHLVAVWDGRPDHRPHSTAAAVRIARVTGVPVTVVWPAGARRTG